VSPRARIYTLVSLSAAGAAAAVVGITVLTANHPPRPPGPRPGKPPFAADWTAPRELTQAVRLAVGSVPRLSALASEHPHSSFVRLNLGLALFWQRDDAGALVAWRQAKRLQPDTPSAVSAGDFLHPTSPSGLPLPSGLPKFKPSFTRARTRVQRLIARGVALQYRVRPLSAEREFSRAAELAPDDPDAQVAAAVGLYDKDRPAAAFSRLGPLVRRFPHAQTVRFHLGLLSIWLGDFAQARREFSLVVTENPRSTYAREAGVLLKRLGSVGTK
jgi:tetratricopeptide (TPR) repeat protein